MSYDSLTPEKGHFGNESGNKSAKFRLGIYRFSFPKLSAFLCF
jgi:hypothetical protein